MAINYCPKVGEVLECDFGDFKANPAGDIDTKNFNGRIPPEMVKKRLVVVLNGKISGACIIVPISSTQDIGKITQNLHIELAASLIKETRFYDNRVRWAKTDLVQQVSKERLNKVRNDRGFVEQSLPRDIVTKIQQGVVRAISASGLLPKQITTIVSNS